MRGGTLVWTHWSANLEADVLLQLDLRNLKSLQICEMRSVQPFSRAATAVVR